MEKYIETNTKPKKRTTKIEVQDWKQIERKKAMGDYKQAKKTHKSEIKQIKRQIKSLKNDVKKHKLLMKQAKIHFQLSK